MRIFKIDSPNREIESEIIDKINNLTKPKGSLGRLEEIALQICLIQQSLSPVLHKPQNIIFAADHGIVREGVSFSAPEVTAQMVANFSKGGAGINMFSRQHNFDLKLVDCGVNADFKDVDGLYDRKIRKSTSNYLHEAAMSSSEFEKAIEIGVEMVEIIAEEGSNIVSFGEMGITNTSSSAIWMHLLTGIDFDKCIGAGSGLDAVGIAHKKKVLENAMANCDVCGDVMEVLRYFGGFEMIATIGGMLRAAEKGMIILIDGFIMTACLLAACLYESNVKKYCIFGHCGDEAGHRELLNYLEAKPLLDLGLKLGEGTGAICAYPLVVSAVNMINEMSSFKEASVTKYF